MKELTQSKNKYTVTNENGFYTINASKPVSLREVHYDGEGKRLILAVTHFKTFALYDEDYIFLDDGMNITNVLSESEGSNPTFITAPDNSVWVELCSTKTDNKLVVLPIENRARIKKDIFISNLGHDHEACGNGKTYFLFTDIFDSTKKKQDKMWLMDFDKTNLFKGIKMFKIPLPQRNVPCLCGDTINLATDIYPQSEVLHREITAKGEVLRERQFGLGVPFYNSLPVSLSFDGDSTFLAVSENKLYSVKVSENAEVTNTDFREVKAVKEDFSNLFPPCVLSANSYIVRFNFMGGDGYALIENNEITECFTREKDTSVYTDEISGVSYDILNPRFYFTDITATSDTEYLLFFSPHDPRKETVGIDVTQFKIKKMSVSRC